MISNVQIVGTIPATKKLGWSIAYNLIWAVISSLWSSYFETEVRYSGISFVYHVPSFLVGILKTADSKAPITNVLVFPNFCAHHPPNSVNGILKIHAMIVII